MKDKRIREQCQLLFLSGYPFVEITKLTGVDRRTLHRWKTRYKWADGKETTLTDAERIEKGISKLVLKLIDKAEQKPGKETLINLENALKIYNEHQKVSVVKTKK